MKNKKILIIIILIIVTLVLTIQIVLSKNKIINISKKTIKEMSSTTQETELNNQINSLNAEHTEYMNYIQTCKTKIATALTNEGVPTSNEATLETMAESISNVLQERTKDATATAENITAGKTAYVNGQKITGTYVDNENEITLTVKTKSTHNEVTGQNTYSYGTIEIPNDNSNWKTITYVEHTDLQYWWLNGDNRNFTNTIDISSYNNIQIVIMRHENTNENNGYLTFTLSK